jgi:hypothetical protein
MWGGFAAAGVPDELSRRVRRCAALLGRQRVRRSSHRAPPICAPIHGEGDLWWDLLAVGRVTGSLLRLLRTPPIPNPFP